MTSHTRSSSLHYALFSIIASRLYVVPVLTITRHHLTSDISAASLSSKRTPRGSIPCVFTVLSSITLAPLHDRPPDPTSCHTYVRTQCAPKVIMRHMHSMCSRHRARRSSRVSRWSAAQAVRQNGSLVTLVKPLYSRPCGLQRGSPCSRRQGQPERSSARPAAC